MFYTNSIWRRYATAVLFVFTATASQADGLPPAVQAKVDTGLKNLAAWAASAEVVAAVKEANANKGIAGMTNGKWEELPNQDPVVSGVLSSGVSKKLGEWGKQGFEKLMLRNAEGALVAGSEKPLLYNNSTRPQFKVAMEGKPFQAKEIKPDPTTQVKSVQIGVPVKDGDKVIGVLHAGVTVE